MDKLVKITGIVALEVHEIVKQFSEICWELPFFLYIFRNF
jgi:hypothetical protein